MKKKAQNLSVTTIILIIIGLVVLVILIMGFTMGWGKLKEWIIPSNNVKAIVDQCNIACSTDQKYSYCFEKRNLKSEDENLEGVTCYSLAKEKPVYGINSCPSINCEIYESKEVAKEACDAKGEGAEVWYLNGPKVEEYVCAGEAEK